ncbi:hypothetical protein GNE00_15095 [Pseudomonas sp. JL972]|uniref:hypothetical protein n=1 Tax=Stutzerimonas degradans TaxID=2968968 RepID=UPI0012D9B8AB|nr:hypothetical protein [Stutzerimonas degradans]MTZ15077.1 hypothetical protein [Stutzerimonas degradans]
MGKQGLVWLKANATVPGVVVLFVAAWMIMLAVQNGEAGAAWVQAIGSVAAILAAWWLANGQAQREREHARREEARLRIERKYQRLASDAAECSRVFYLASEFSFLLMRISTAKSELQLRPVQRWSVPMHDLLGRLSYTAGLAHAQSVMVFELRQELLKLMDTFQLDGTENWLIRFVCDFENVRDRVAHIESAAQIAMNEAEVRLRKGGATGVPGDMFTAQALGLSDH